jgi:hypothetical protein
MKNKLKTKKLAPSKHKALSSIPTTGRKEGRKDGRKRERKGGRERGRKASHEERGHLEILQDLG